MGLLDDEMVVVTKDGEATTRDEIRVRVISPQPALETPLNIGGVKAQIEAVDKEILRLQQILTLLNSKETMLTALLVKVEEVTKDIVLKTEPQPEPIEKQIK